MKDTRMNYNKMNMDQLDQVTGGTYFQFLRDVDTMKMNGWREEDPRLEFEPEDLEKLAAKYGFTFKYHPHEDNEYIDANGRKYGVDWNDPYFWNLVEAIRADNG